MNLSFDLGHPAHFHLFKNFILYLKSKGHNVYIHVRSKDIIETLLKHQQIEYTKSNSTVLQSKSRAFYNHLISYSRFIKNKSIDYHFGTSVVSGLIARITGSKFVGFSEDDFDVVPLQKILGYYPSYIYIRPATLKLKEKTSSKIVYHNSYHELAYLHPNNFQPDPNVLKKYNLEPFEFVVSRFSALMSHHDTGAQGISESIWQSVLERVANYKMVKSVEGESSHQIEPWDMHHVLAHAKLIISDSQTMTAEGSVLGVPALRLNSFVGRIEYLNELEHQYQLTFGFKPHEGEKLLNKIEELVNLPDLKTIWQKRKQHMLSEKTDMNQWMIKFFEEKINHETD